MFHVSLLAIPEAGSSLLGAAELLASVGTAWESVVSGVKPQPVYKTCVVSESAEPLRFDRWSVKPDAAIDEVARTDAIFIPSLWIQPGETFTGRYREVKDWLIDRYHDGAIICAACTGVQLLAETGLLNGEVATTHWAYADGLRSNHPEIDLHPDKILVESGVGRRLITSGGHATWYDLVLHLIGRTKDKQAAVQAAKFFLLQWHTDGQSPYSAFSENLLHGDALVRQAQEWLRTHHSHPNPVAAVEALVRIPPRSFKRRFKQATGLSPLEYVQHLRIDCAKTLLEEGALSVDAISWKVGYEDVAFFSRLFKRITGLTPSAYRRKFSLPVSFSTARA
ncbi:MAG: helix-turn-helix domain-containing protein [Pseudomonadota bacterium]